MQLHYGVLTGDVDAVGALLQAGANPNVADGNCDTPLHYAVRYIDIVVCVVRLSDCGAWYSITDNAAMVRVLLENKANVNAVGCSRQTPLFVAAMCMSPSSPLLVCIPLTEARVQSTICPPCRRCLLRAPTPPSSAIWAVRSCRWWWPRR